MKRIMVASCFVAAAVLMLALCLHQTGRNLEIVGSAQAAQPRVVVLKIATPTNGQKVHHRCPMSGTVDNMPAGMQLWVVKEPSPNNFHPDAPKATITGNEWRATAYVGNNRAGSDTGTEFPIHIVLTSAATGQKFEKYLQTAAANGWPGLDTIFDGRILATTKVIRDDSAK